MRGKLLVFIDKTIWFSYLALAIATPLIFTTQNTELYEVPKMLFVYLFATIIFFLTLLKVVSSTKITIPKNWPLFTFAIFVVVQIISTLFSVDKFTSIFGFPSRLNGGLLSQFAYLAIFFCALLNLTALQGKKILIAIVASALFVSLWGIPAHFGKDPSCWVLTNKLTSSCWQKEFNPQLRIFSTLGQPNWLASYLVIAIPITLSAILTFKNLRAKLFFATTLVILFTAQILTNSRSGAIALGVALVIFLVFAGKQTILKNLKFLVPIFALFILITLLFGTTLTSRIAQPFTKKESLNITSQQSGAVTQSNSLPTESSKIRLIVWRGAFLIFKRWPILGSGPETFVSSYYQLRPSQHNQTSEWEFFYNKAHNEFLNYLANTGFLGMASFLAFIVFTFITLYNLSKQKDGDTAIFAKGVLAAFIGYLITIFFGFSTVATQVTIFLALISIFVIARNKNVFTVDLNFLKGRTKSTASFAVTFLAVIALSFVLRLYLADIFEKRAQNYQGENTTKELLSYRNATLAYPAKNPYLLANFANSLAAASTKLQDKKDAQVLAQKADENTQSALNTSPKNYLITQKAANTYILIADYDKNYRNKAQIISNQLTNLAPTYPPAYLAAAKIQIVLNNKQEALNLTKKALELKPDYIEAQQLLDQLK